MGQFQLWTEPRAARPKSGRPLHRQPVQWRDGLVEASASRVLRDAEGTFRFKFTSPRFRVLVSFDLAETKRPSFRAKRGIPPCPSRSKQRGIPRFARNDERKKLVAKRRAPNDTTTRRAPFIDTLWCGC